MKSNVLLYLAIGGLGYYIYNVQQKQSATNARLSAMYALLKSKNIA